jgi:radical SAM superfamily enzyme YgiQ (UPF0313 family)
MVDLPVQGLDEASVAEARFVGISVPMHTALRLGARAARRIRQVNSDCSICFYGLYASLNAGYLLDTLSDYVVGGEYEEALVGLVEALDGGSEVAPSGVGRRGAPAAGFFGRLSFPPPLRSGLAPFGDYARLVRDGAESLVGYTEASRGCKHGCLHCPIPAVYGGRFFAVPQDVVLEDVRRQAAAGARHITFGDPDFLNGPTHALRIARALHDEFPELTFDFTAKVEHLLRHRDLLGEIVRLGCVFVVSAFESLSDSVLGNLRKGHSRDDISRVLEAAREAGVALRPSWVPFTPWTSAEDYLELLDFVEEEDMVDAIDPVQYAIRLLVPPGSLLLSSAAMRPHLGPLVPEMFTYTWKHPDPRMDRLQEKVKRLVEEAAVAGHEPAVTLGRIRSLAARLAGEGRERAAAGVLRPPRPKPPHLTEPWFC